MKIPESFQLHGVTYKTVLLPDLITQTDNMGEAGYRTGTVRLQSVLPGACIREDRQEQVFYHELVHVILYEMHNKLRDDEPFVDVFASLLHQALKTMTYKEIDNGSGKEVQQLASGKTEIERVVGPAY